MFAVDYLQVCIFCLFVIMNARYICSFQHFTDDVGSIFVDLHTGLAGAIVLWVTSPFSSSAAKSNEGHQEGQEAHCASTSNEGHEGHEVKCLTQEIFKASHWTPMKAVEARFHSDARKA